jgi:hypothetical protein
MNKMQMTFKSKTSRANDSTTLSITGTKIQQQLTSITTLNTKADVAEIKETLDLSNFQTKLLDLLEENSNATLEFITEMRSKAEKPVEETVRKYKILKRTKNSKNVNLTLPDIEEIKDFTIISDIDLNNELDKFHKPFRLLKESSKISPILVEDTDSEGKIVSSKKIGKILSIDYLYNDLNIIGGGLKTKLVSVNKENKYYNKSYSIEETNEEVEIFDEIQARKNAIKEYNIKEDDDLFINVKLCYYSNNDSDYIVPAYHISGKKDNINLLETVIPACKDHIPEIKWDNISVKSVENISYKDSNTETKDKDSNTETKDKDSNTETKDKDSNTETKESVINKICFLFDMKTNYTEKIELSSIYDVVYENKSIKLYIPYELTKNERSKLSNVNLYISTVNKYGFSTMTKQILNLSEYIDYFKLIEIKPLSSGVNRHNYGIEWAETPLGATIYPRFIEEMNKHAFKEYSLDSTKSKEVHFKDQDNDGLDHCFVDNVDISAYIGHGSGDGITFVTSDDDSNLTFTDAQAGKAWGNKDMEYMALLSCKVLKETTSNGNWAERWGPSFNGMHLMLGFQTNASVGDHNMLKFYAENMYSEKDTVMMSWFNAAINDQPNNRDAVVMGPLIKNNNKNDYNSVLSTIPDLYRAHWSEKTWGVGSGPGIDIPRTNVAGWWRVVITV